MAICDVCFRKCDITEGKTGFCRVRSARDGEVIQVNYGKVTGLALDPIEKKPLSRFHPGSLILSLGSYGCNLRCPFCQNSDISWSERAYEYEEKCDFINPERLVDMALALRTQGNIGIAYTYNEPLIGYEYVRDAAKIAHEKGLVNVLVSNGTASIKVLEEIAPYIDAMNIDLKGFTEDYYNECLGGDFSMVKAFIKRAAQVTHLELTTLIVPGKNDTEEEMMQISEFIANLEDENGEKIGKSIPLHISRFFPRFNMTDREATDVELIYRLAEVARKRLDYVYCGNV